MGFNPSAVKPRKDGQGAEGKTGANEVNRTPQILSAKARDSVVPRRESVKSPFREANSVCNCVSLTRRKEHRFLHAPGKLFFENLNARAARQHSSYYCPRRRAFALHPCVPPFARS